LAETQPPVSYPGPAPAPKGWSRIARRSRVPLGFLLAIFFMWFARPTWISLAVGAMLAAPGLLLRAYAAGYVKKDRELTTTGPYAHTRNPLYLGSVIAAAGCGVASRNLWIVVAMLVMFFAIYIPVIRDEEAYLGKIFSGFDEYRKHVPRLLPRLSAFRAGTEVTSGSFSRSLYLRHREYNAVMGAVALLAALAVKILFISGLLHLPLR